MTFRSFDYRKKTAEAVWFGALLSMLILSGIPASAHAVGKDAQELMKLREKYAPANCELTKLYRKLGEARKARDQARVQALTERMQTLDKPYNADKARMEVLRKRVRNTPDYSAIMEQQLKFDKACNQRPKSP